MKIFAFAVAFALLPLSAVAGNSRLEAPATVTFKMGVTNLRRISAYSARGRVSMTKTTCFSSPPGDRDIVRVTNIGSTDDKKIMAIDIYAKNLGTCTVEFVDKGGDTATTTVTVSR
jgi:hypothetical protein